MLSICLILAIIIKIFKNKKIIKKIKNNINYIIIYKNFIFKLYNVSHGHICHPAIFATFFPIQKTFVRNIIT